MLTATMRMPPVLSHGAVARMLVLVAMVFFGADLAPAQPPIGRRDQVSPARAQRMEALLSRAFPGATLDWDREQLAYPDGRRVAFTFGFYREQPRGGEVFAIASHAPDERQRDTVRRLQAFGTPPADQPPAAPPSCKLSLMRADGAGAVLGYKETGIDIVGVASTCDRVNFEYAYDSAGLPSPALTGLAAPAWPLVLINYSTLHVVPDAWATITWAAVLDTDVLAWVSRLPVFFHGTRRDGRSAVFAIKNDRGGGGGAWVFSGFNERGDQPRWQARVPCQATGCKVEPEAVLDEALRSSAWK